MDSSKRLDFNWVDRMANFGFRLERGRSNAGEGILAGYSWLAGDLGCCLVSDGVAPEGVAGCAEDRGGFILFDPACVHWSFYREFYAFFDGRGRVQIRLPGAGGIWQIYHGSVDCAGPSAQYPGGVYVPAICAGFARAYPC